MGCQHKVDGVQVSGCCVKQATQGTHNCDTVCASLSYYDTTLACTGKETNQDAWDDTNTCTHCRAQPGQGSYSCSQQYAHYAPFSSAGASCNYRYTSNSYDWTCTQNYNSYYQLCPCGMP